MIELLKDDLKKKFETFSNLRQHPALFIADYFYSIRNQVDYETEKLMFESQETLEIEHLNEVREILIDELNHNEKRLIADCRSVGVDEESAKCFQGLQESLGSLLTSGTSSEEDLKKLAVRIENASHEFKRGLLKNQTFMFIQFGLTDYGTLVEFEDLFINEFEIKCIM